MDYRKVGLTFLLCLLCSPNLYAQSSTSTTEQQIIDMLNSMDRAARRKNIAGMIAPLAVDVKIRLTLTVPKSNEPKVLSLTKEQYAYQARMAFKVRFKYAVERKNIRVKIYDDKTALVTSELYETFSTSRLAMRAVTSEVAYLAERDGKLLFTSIESNTRLYQ